jgi:hypothetical protein
MRAAETAHRLLLQRSEIRSIASSRAARRLDGVLREKKPTWLISVQTFRNQSSLGEISLGSVSRV